MPLGGAEVVTNIESVPPSVWPNLIELQQKAEASGLESVERSMATVCALSQTLVPCDRITVLMTVRSATSRSDDALDGWRLAWLHSPDWPLYSKLLRPLARGLRWGKEYQEKFRLGGTLRAGVQSLDDPSLSASHRRFNKAIGVLSRMVSITPVGENIEVMLLHNRRHERFTEEDADIGIGIAQVLSRCARQWSFRLGVLSGRVFSKREQQVLLSLLRGQSEKEGAASLEISEAYFHQVVVRLYRQIGVSSRAELMAAYIDHEAPDHDWSGGLMELGHIEPG